MMRERVVITGCGALSPFGESADTLWEALLAGKSALSPLPGREAVSDLGAAVAGLVPEIDAKQIPRVHRRAMSRMGVYAYLAAKEALASYPDHPSRIGVALGSTLGSPDTLTEFFREYLGHNNLSTVRSTTFFKTMGHGMASSLALALGFTGRIVAPAAACATGLIAVGLGYECISSGRESVMLCGGAEEFNVLTAATFDHILAASHNPDPGSASRPFDSKRDGLVCSEGAGLLLLESLSNARKRNAPIMAEIAGFATNSSPKHIVHPDSDAISECMAEALEDAKLSPRDVTAINAHATATIEGDRAEAKAIAGLFGDRVPVASLKGQLGHCMAASGSLELIAGLQMMKKGIFLPNHNLTDVDPECAGILLPIEKLNFPIDVIVKNSFALGGVNASLVIKRYVY